VRHIVYKAGLNLSGSTGPDGPEKVQASVGVKASAIHVAINSAQCLKYTHSGDLKSWPVWQ
jgi:hypothetical protein